MTSTRRDGPHHHPRRDRPLRTLKMAQDGESRALQGFRGNEPFGAEPFGGEPVQGGFLGWNRDTRVDEETDVVDRRLVADEDHGDGDNPGRLWVPAGYLDVDSAKAAIRPAHGWTPAPA